MGEKKDCHSEDIHVALNRGIQDKEGGSCTPFGLHTNLYAYSAGRVVSHHQRDIM